MQRSSSSPSFASRPRSTRNGAHAVIRAVLTSLALAWAVTAIPNARAVTFDRVAVVVNGDIITLSEVEERAGPSLPPANDSGSESRRRDFLKAAADQLVAEKLLGAEVAREGLTPSAVEIDAAIEDVKRANRLDDRTFELALEQQGLSHKRYREMLSEQIGRMKLLEMKVKARVAVSDDDIRNRYARMTRTLRNEEEVHARDIFVPKGDDAAAARAKVENARRRVLAGEEFALVARETGGPFAESGGDLGWFRRGMMVGEIEDAAFALEPGKLSEIIDSEAGYHLILLEERRSISSARPLSEAREELRQQILAEKMQTATEEYVEELRADATIELKIP